VIDYWGLGKGGKKQMFEKIILGVAGTSVFGVIAIQFFLLCGVGLVPSSILAILSGIGITLLLMYLNEYFEPKSREYRYEWQQNSSDECNYFAILAKDREEADRKAKEFSGRLAILGTTVMGEFFPIN